MNVRKWIVAAAMLLAVVAVGAYKLSSAVRTRVAAATGQWTEEARRQNPQGYFDHVEQRLAEELEKLETTRRELALASGELSRKMHQYQALAGQTDRLAEEFREVYRAAADSDYPVTVRTAGYTQKQLVNQVSMLLAEADTYRTMLQKLQDVQNQADENLQQIVVRIDKTEGELAMVGTKRQLLASRELSHESERLAGEIDRLFDENRLVIESNPVRTVRELLAAGDRSAVAHPNLEAARQFLAAAPAVAPAAEISAPANVPHPAPAGTSAAVSRGKPIFAQE